LNTLQAVKRLTLQISIRISKNWSILRAMKGDRTGIVYTEKLREDFKIYNIVLRICYFVRYGAIVQSTKDGLVVSI